MNVLSNKIMNINNIAFFSRVHDVNDFVFSIYDPY